MKLLIKLAIALTPAVTALQFPSPTSLSNGDQICRRSAVSKLITSSTAAVASGSASSLLMPTGVANAVDSVTQVTLNSQNKKPFPLASFGLQVYNDDIAYKLTLTALEVGYRNFFASVLANNQKGFAKAVKASGIPRDELYICGTVLSNRVNGEKAAYQKTKQGCLENMAAMAAGNIDKLDMIMLDYPGPNDESVRGQWQAFEEMHSKDGTVDDLAVSNFSPNQLDAILVNKDAIKPTVNQLPFSVAYHPEGILDYNAKRDILVQSWSPLSRVLGRYGNTLDAIGKNYGKSAAQVGLRWIVQSGAAFSTQSKSKSHFEEDLNVFDFALSDDEMAKIAQLAAA
mmetsp:Transcript_32005/g.69137  ORF Transcript_32005/g.69137 Transcript_32005/m.69137 type:complete len:342 (+) Transcript_32005:112-1137(+)